MHKLKRQGFCPAFFIQSWLMPAWRLLKSQRLELTPFMFPPLWNFILSTKLVLPP